MFAAALMLSVLSGAVFKTATVDITPDEALPLGGYTARGDDKMVPGGDPLYARALVFETDGQKVAIVSIETLTVPESLYAAVKSRIPDDVFLFLVATHTHSAPDSQMLNDRMTFKIPGIAAFSRRWLEWYAEKISSAVTQALDGPAMDAGGLRLLSTRVDANHGRRKGAKPDKTATWIDFQGKPVLTVYAAHGTIYDEKRMRTSGDWPGAYSRAEGGLVLPGAIGDVSPDYPTDDPVENLAATVEKLRQGRLSAKSTALLGKLPTISATSEPIALDPPVPHPDFAKDFGAPPPLDQVLIKRFAPPEAAVSLLQIGSLLLIGIPGEPTSETGRKVQVLAESMGFPHSVVVSHCNGWIGYILQPDDYDRGGYEATLSFNGRDTAERVTEAVARGLRRLAPVGSSRRGRKGRTEQTSLPGWPLRRRLAG